MRLIKYKIINYLFNRINVNVFSIGKSYLTRCSFRGKIINNKIIIGNNSRLRNCSFYINGYNNKIVIGDNCILNNTSFWVADDDNNINIGNMTTITNDTQFAALEGTNINVGSDCMFSHDIFVRTSDSHSVLNSEGTRTNRAKDISIGNHCWIGMQSLILKGGEIKDNSIVAARSVVTKQFEANVLIGGSPAQVLKNNINWSRKRI